MAKVDWITWKTDPKELIDKEKIESNLNNKTTEINSIMDNLSNSLKLEVEKGGLNKESLHINGETPGNEVANKILNKIEVIKNINTKLNNKIMDQANKQKQVEKEQLIKPVIKDENNFEIGAAYNSETPIIEYNNVQYRVLDIMFGKGNYTIEF